jgi:hypothetical protein
MTLQVPGPLREHPLESLLAAGLLLFLLIGASDGGVQNPQQNQAVSACQTANCATARPAG